jgi:hypothetical protein
MQGAQVISQMGNTQFDQNYRTQMLDLARKRATKEDLPTGFQPGPNGGLAPIPGGPADPNYKRQVGDRQNAPPGYKWADPNDPNAGLAPIPGGPAEKVDSEVAARIGLGRSFLGQLPAIRKSVEEGTATGLYDWSQGKLGRGRAGEVHRQIASGAEALLRNLTGAGMSQSEANDYVDRYRPSWKDDAPTLLSKMDQLERELNSVMETVGRGRGGTMPPLGQRANPQGGLPSSLPRPSSPAEAAKLPKGSKFIDPNGVERTVP